MMGVGGGGRWGTQWIDVMIATLKIAIHSLSLASRWGNFRKKILCPENDILTQSTENIRIDYWRRWRRQLPVFLLIFLSTGEKEPRISLSASISSQKSDLSKLNERFSIRKSVSGVENIFLTAPSLPPSLPRWLQSMAGSVMTIINIVLGADWLCENATLAAGIFLSGSEIYWQGRPSQQSLTGELVKETSVNSFSKIDPLLSLREGFI